MNKPASPPLVSTVTLSWNRKDDVAESVQRILDSSYPTLEIIVCDNGSTDGTVEMLRKFFPAVKVIALPDNIGIEAYNVGFRAAQGEYIVILDDDSCPAPNALERMVEKFENDPKLGIVAFDVRNFFSYEEAASMQIVSNSTATTESYAMGFNGAGAGVRKDVFEKAGYYPGEFFLYCNEQDLSLRVLDAGFTIKFFSDVVSYHKYSPVNRTSTRAPFFYCRNSFWLIWKNYPLFSCFFATLKLGWLVAYHSFEQRTTIYLRAQLAALKGAWMIGKLRKPVSPELAKSFRAPLELAFAFYR